METPTTSVGEAEAGQPLRDLPATGEAGVEVAAGAATDPIPLLTPGQGTGLNGSDMTVLRISLQKNSTLTNCLISSSFSC